MKRILLLLLVATSLSAKAQLFNNEWIDYNKTYYKFKVYSSNIYRISQASLSSIGLGSTDASFFQLWRNGEEVSLYTSVQSGPLGGGDYIEFWGEMNDGKPDNALYRQPDFQLSDKYSLENDTASFFLTVNPAGNNRRLLPVDNNVAGNVLAPEPFFMHTATKYFTSVIGGGRSEVVGTSYTYSSSYDGGEGWVSTDIGANIRIGYDISNLSFYSGPGAPDATFRLFAVGNAVNPRRVYITLYDDSLGSVTMDYYDLAKYSQSFPVSRIKNDDVKFGLFNKSPNPADRVSFSNFQFEYPRKFIFDNTSSFAFKLPANSAGNYLEIAGFDKLGSTPVLYDLTNGKRYVVNVSNPALLKIALQPSSVERNLLLVHQNAASIGQITAFTTRNFVNFLLPANQGDFLMITNPVLTGAVGGDDPVEGYRQYRGSPAGGSYTARVYLMPELEDQFAFGIRRHPLSIRNFVRWARAKFSLPVKDVLLLGKGIAYNQTAARIFTGSKSDLDRLDLVPTFGSPASDNLLTAVGASSVPLTPIGRISVISKDELAIYLAKVKEYEQAQTISSPLIADKAWMKNVIHVVGGTDVTTSNLLLSALDGHKAIIEDTMYSANVTTLVKTSADAVQDLSSALLVSKFNEGVSILTYFGHSSSSTLEFNLDNPQNYSNKGKYPVFIVMGCNAGNFYSYNTARFSTKETLSEKYVLAPDAGSIAFLASTHLGIIHYCDIYNTRLYKAASVTKYGGTLGEIMDEAIKQVFNLTSENDFYARFQCEQFTLHGDPALRMNSSEKPDYVIEDPMVKITPAFIPISETRFKVDANFFNIGRGTNKNIVVELKRTYPDKTVEVIRRDTIPFTKFSDSLSYSLPVVASRDKGLNQITITVDADNAVDESYETNNSITKDIYIIEDDVRPIYPYNFSIINKQNIKVVASTANAFAETRNYLMEMDTTELFNSPVKISRTTTAAGGPIEFMPGITFMDSTVYYWRVAEAISTGDYKWNKSSFIYINGPDVGFSQSHLYQHLKSDRVRLSLDSTSRVWGFGTNLNNVFSHNGVYPNTSPEGGFYTGTINDVEGYIGPGCTYDELIFTVIDSTTFKPWKNDYTGASGLYQSYKATCGAGREYNFEFLLNDKTWRKKIMDFIDLIPEGDYVLIRSNSSPNVAGNTYTSAWKADDAFYGAGNTLYDKLYRQGFADVDSFNRPRAWSFMFKKDKKDKFTPKWSFSDGLYDAITLSADCSSRDTLGYVTSPSFGPAKGWHQLKWRGKTRDIVPGDVETVDVIGVGYNGEETTVFNGLTPADQDFDISAISATEYPYLKLRMRNQDSINYTPYQLRYWMLTYDPVPEGAIAPNLYFTTRDTVEVGEPFNFGIAFRNISDIDFDSVKVKLTLTDKNNIENIVPIPRQKKLTTVSPNDTLRLNVPIDTRALSGHSTLFVNFNPDNDQPEQYSFNNYAFRNLYVRPDSINPLMDVTFDGVHILNRDIVASKPTIIAKLKDDAKWMLLDDTSLVSVKVKFPDGSIRPFYFNNNDDTLQFIPALHASDNTASINFKPSFLADGEYELQVYGKDGSGNRAGAIQYRVSFVVINKPMISNMLNYPNPFTTSTAFVFTITGSQVPQNIRIQILTITGKIVRDITKDELGPLHIGRNITEFKWDGTDQYGSKLANGIYLYRVITNLNGKSLDKYKAEGDNTDKYFNKGYGKMYLMR